MEQWNPEATGTAVGMEHVAVMWTETAGAKSFPWCLRSGTVIKYMHENSCVMA